MTARQRHDWRDRVLGWIEPEDNPSATVYGTIAVGLLLAAEDPARETYPRVVVATLVAIAAYWLAHGYARWLGGRLTGGPGHGRRWSLHQLGHALTHEWPVVEGAVIPVVVLLVCWLSDALLPTAVAAATWTAAGAVLAFELASGLRRRLHALQLLGNAVVGVALASTLIAVKLLLH